jgi:DNA-binding NtrC family response regulator/tetratricopeptide (TPR) repeat protein
VERAASRLASLRSDADSVRVREGAPRAEGEVDLAELDALVADSGGGFVVVRCASASDASTGPLRSALAAHVGRRARAAGRASLQIGENAASDPWHELAVRLGVTTSADPTAVARALAERAASAVVVVREDVPTLWGRSVALDLAAQVDTLGAAGPLVLVLAPRSASELPGVRHVELEEPSSRAALRLFWDALASEAGERMVPSLARVEALERWWAAARATPSDAVAVAPSLSPGASQLLRRLVLAERPWPARDAGKLAPLAACAELDHAGLVEAGAAGAIACAAGARAAADEATREDAAAVADALEVVSPDDPDPWAFARASELHARAGRADRAEAAAVRSLLLAADSTARADFWARWRRTLRLLPPDGAAARLQRSAELGLRVGDVDRALDFARDAVAEAGESHDALLTLGRATAARGDLTTAAIALQKAMERSPGVPARARVAVEMAEVRYLAGDMAEARRHAEAGLAEAGDVATRLGARNVLGKLHLAASAWDEAERHFAADACDAACAGDVSCELRARVNRAIALLSSSRRDEARVMLTAVLEDGERQGELRAISFALANLAAIATLKHEYGEALRLSERSIEVRRRIGERLGLARVIVNLADLRLRVGLIDEAEQALGFGRLACGPGMPATRAVHFALVAARVHLARGRTLEGSVEIGAAIAGAAHSTDGALRGECHRVAARIALEDGDLARASDAIEKARPETGAGRRAELAVLSAALLRARGEAFDEAVREALALARETDDLEAGMEAHVLAHLAAAGAGDGRRAAAHLEAALAVRERLARSIPEALRGRFLARRDLAELARLEEAAAESNGGCDRCGDPACPGCAPATTRSVDADRAFVRGASREPSSRASAPAPALERMVGHHPAMLSLATAIRKVAQTDATVLVHGESGTGKELVAEALHELGPRRAGPLVKVNCAALVETLLLSELFGHEKGSFTGAAARRRGRFEMAEGGTLFLDEIGDISARTQVALLRVLQDRTFERVGGTTPIRANVRVVCATHRDLRAMVARGEFREDLYYRLRGVVLEVPALRQRIEDLPLVAAALLARIGAERGEPPKRLSQAAVEGLAAHAWPGNVRELDNALRAATVFAEGSTVELDDLAANVEGLRALRPANAPAAQPFRPGTDPAFATGVVPPSAPAPSADAPLATAPGPQGSPVDVAYTHIRAGVSLGEMKRLIERDCIARALGESSGNITRAAALLGMKRPRLSQLVKQYGFGAAGDDALGDADGGDSDADLDGAVGCPEQDEGAGCSTRTAAKGPRVASARATSRESR